MIHGFTVILPGLRYTMEINPITNQINDLRERSMALRGYL